MVWALRESDANYFVKEIHVLKYAVFNRKRFFTHFFYTFGVIFYWFKKASKVSFLNFITHFLLIFKILLIYANLKQMFLQNLKSDQLFDFEPISKDISYLL